MIQDIKPEDLIGNVCHDPGSNYGPWLVISINGDKTKYKYIFLNKNNGRKTGDAPIDYCLSRIKSGTRILYKI